MDELHSRERLAGYDTDVLSNAIACVVGAGALANYVVQAFALAGVGEVRIVDFDTIEPSNLTRSPLFPRDSIRGAKPKFKARSMASELLRLSYAERPIVRSAITKYEEVGLAFFEGASVIVGAADSFSARADVSDIARLLGIPFCEAGFRGLTGSFSFFSNQTAEEACFRCLMPSTNVHGRMGCALYAREIAAAGRTPATPTVAGFFGALVAEAAIAAMHGEFPMSEKFLTFDLRTGKSVQATVAPDPNCPGVHTCWQNRIEDIEVHASEPVTALFERASASFREPAIHLRRPYLVSAPCELCGRTVNIQSPLWRVAEPPRCKTCPGGQPSWGTVPRLLTSVTPQDQAAKRPLVRFGIRPRDVLEIEDRGTPGVSRIVRLAGSLDELLLTWTREKKGEGAVASDPAASEGEEGGPSF